MKTIESNQHYLKVKFLKDELRDNSFENITFQDCDFKDLSFKNIQFNSCSFLNCKFNRCEFQDVLFKSGNWQNVFMRFSTLIFTSLENQKLISVFFEESNQIDLKITKSQICSVTLEYHQKVKCVVNDCHIYNSSFSSSVFELFESHSSEFYSVCFQKCYFFKFKGEASSFYSCSFYKMLSHEGIHQFQKQEYSMCDMRKIELDFNLEKLLSDSGNIVTKNYKKNLLKRKNELFLVFLVGPIIVFFLYQFAMNPDWKSSMQLREQSYHYFTLQEYEKALRGYNSLVKRNPADIRQAQDDKLLQAVCLFKLNQFNDIPMILEDILEMDKDTSGEIVLRVARLYWNLGQNRKALELLYYIVENFKKHYVLTPALLDIYYLTRDDSRSVENKDQLEKILSVAQDDKFLLAPTKELVDIFYKLDQKNDADDVVNQTLQRLRNKALKRDLIIFYLQFLSAKNEFEKAERWGEVQSNLFSDEFDFNKELSEINKQKLNYDLLENSHAEQYEQGVDEAEKKMLRLELEKTRVAGGKKISAESVQLIKSIEGEMIRLQHVDAFVWNLRQREGHLEAITFVLDVLDSFEISDNVGHLYGELAELYRDLGDFEKSENAYHQAYEYSQKSWPKIALGDLYRREEKFKKSLDVLEEVSQESLDDHDKTWLLFELGRTYLSLQDNEKAKELFGKAMALAPEDWMIDEYNKFFPQEAFSK